MEIEIYADVVCPWCYLGKRRLEQALAEYDGDVTVHWRAFQLDPTAPRDGLPLVQYLAERYGGEAQAHRMVAHVTQAAHKDGLTLNFDRAIAANSFDAHRVIWFAGSPVAVAFGAGPDTQSHLVEVLYRSHFTDGLDLNSAEALIAAADEVGLDPDRVRRLLSNDEGKPEVHKDLAEARALGVTGVPTFIFNDRYALSGAQDPDTFRRVFDVLAGDLEDEGARQPA